MIKYMKYLYLYAFWCIKETEFKSVRNLRRYKVCPVILNTLYNSEYSVIYLEIASRKKHIQQLSKILTEIIKYSLFVVILN